MNNERRAMLLMVVFVGLWAVVEALAPHVRRPYSPYQIVWTRYAAHLAFMVAVWGRSNPSVLWRTRRPAYQMTRSLLMLGMPACFIAAVQHGVAVGTVMAVFWLSPILIVTLARLFLGERVGIAAWLSSALASIGGILMYRVGHLPSVGELVLPFAMALCFSAYVVMTRPLRSEPVETNLFYTALGVFLALSLAMPRVWITPTPGDLVILCGVGVIGLGGLYALDRAVHLAPVSRTAPITAVHIAAATAIGIAVHEGRPHGDALVGLVLVGAVAAFVWVTATQISTPTHAQKDVA